MSLSPDCFETTKKLLPVDEAIDLLMDRLGPATGVERVSLDGALGRVLAEDVVSDIVVPPDDNSAMDGYALRFSDLTPGAATTLPVGLRVPAGHPAERPLGPGEAARIFTGAPIPEGADTVVMQEVCTEADGQVTIPAGQTRGDNVRPAGGDVTVGQRVLSQGRRLGPMDLAMAAQVGRCDLAVYKRLTVAVFTTGDEIVEPGEPLPPGALYNANRRALISLLTELGVEVVDLGNLPDKPDLIRAALDRAAESADLVMTSGGVSVGGEDHVKDAVAALGTINFWRLALKPGKPLAFGTLKGKPFLGFPGNPVSTFVTFCLVGRPVTLRLSGVEGGQLAPRRYPVAAGFAMTRKGGRREFPRGRVRLDETGRAVVELFPSQSSNLISSVTRSDGLVDLGEDRTEINEGDLIPFLPFSELLF
jgi:molybdopterin molybdotransferase